MESLPNQSDKEFEIQKRLDDFIPSNEQINLWFAGSVMRTNPHFKNGFRRLVPLHNRITHIETKYDERFQANHRAAAHLTEYFPSGWCWEIVDRFRNIDANKLGISSEKDRINAFLGIIDLYLTFRGMTLLKSTLDEINTSLDINLTKNDVRSWKIKILRICPDLRKQWKRIRAPSHQTAIVGAVVRIMNRNLVLDSLTPKEIFHLKQTALGIVQAFVQLPKAQRVKNVEIWAQAVCVKALRDTNYCKAGKQENLAVFFPTLPEKTLTVLDNKRWQLDKLLD